MATDVTVGLDPYDRVIRLNFDNVEDGSRAQAEMDENAAEELADAFLQGKGLFTFKDTITGQIAGVPVERSPETARLLKQAASDLRAHKAGQVDLRLSMGKVPNA